MSATLSYIAHIPFDEIKSLALAHAPRLLAEWLPHGKVVKREFQAGSLNGEAGKSFKVDLDTGKWSDFGSSDGGGYDLIDLFARLRHRGDRVPAAREMQEMLGISGANENQQAITYDYRAADGTLAYQVVRKSNPKTFQQRRADGNGGWIEGKGCMAGVERVPYRLPELLNAPVGSRVYIVEGEKDCDALHKLGLIATTNPGGAGKWLPSMSQYLKGRDVVILPDNDEAGSEHALDVGAKLRGIADFVCIVNLPGLPAKGDVSDWLAAGGTREELERFGKVATLDTPSNAPANDDAPPILSSSMWLDSDAWVREDTPLRPWIAEGYFLRGAVTLLTGPPSAMKSSLVLAWSCAIALNCEHGSLRPKDGAGSVLVYNVEDDMQEQRRRLDAVLMQFNAAPNDIAGKVLRAGPTGVGTLVTCANGKKLRDGHRELVNTQAGNDLEALIERYHPDVVFCDPLAELHDGEENDNGLMRSVVAHFRAIAVKYNCAICLLHHTSARGPKPGKPPGGPRIGKRRASRLKTAAAIARAVAPDFTGNPKEYLYAVLRGEIAFDPGRVSVADKLARLEPLTPEKGPSLEDMIGDAFSKLAMPRVVSSAAIWCSDMLRSSARTGASIAALALAFSALTAALRAPSGAGPTAIPSQLHATLACSL